MDIETLIPHRDRMKLINKVLDVTADTAVTSAVVTDRWPLCHESFVDPLVLIEIVAQTAAVQIRMKKGLDSDMGKGLLVGIKNADFFLDRIPLNTVLVTTVKNLSGAHNYNVLEGTVTAGTDLLARIQIQVLRFDSDKT